ncbi:MAG: O-antigen ligase family protein [Mastigocoleus sp.]
MNQYELSSTKLYPKKQNVSYYLLWIWGLIIIGSLVMSPRLGDNGLLRYIRIDDVLFPLTIIVTLIFISCIFPIQKIIFTFSLLYIFNSITLLITHYSGLNTVGIVEKFLPTCKNIQYLIYFCFFFILASKSNSIKQIKFLFITIYILCFSYNLFYALSQVITLKFTGYYGLEIINERSPALTGAVFHIATILCNVLAQLERKYEVKIFWFFFTFLHAVLTILTGSRGAIIALLTYFAFITISNLFSTILLKKVSQYYIKTLLIFSSILVGSLLIISLTPSLNNQIESLLTLLPNRGFQINLVNLGNEARVDNWSNTLSLYFDNVNQFPLLALSGLGSGGIYEIFGRLLNAADSQYVYTVITGGIIGSFLYINAFVQLYQFGKKKISRSTLPLLPNFLGLFWSFMAFSISQEVFHLSKPGGLFWTMCGLLIGSACSNFNKNKYNSN